MTRDDIAISVAKVSKDFYLPHEKTNSIKSTIVNIFNKKDRSAQTQHALKSITFDIKKGEFFGILGRNGSGKSTMLKILAEIYQPTKGSVKVSGKLVPFIELGVGFNPELTGRENVYLNGALLGFSRKEIDEKYDDIVKFAELEAFMDQKLKNYSSGMQVRLAFSVATRAEADILLVDEVLAVGDADFQRKCFQFFKELKKQKKTVVFVSHDMGAVKDFCDRAVLIDEGRVSAEGPAYEIAEEYARLFNEDEDTEHRKDRVEERWGNGAIKLSHPIVDVKKDSITFTVDVAARVAMDDVVYGIRIRNEDDAEVVGTNSTILEKKKISVAPNETATLVWEFPNIFGKGRYYIDPAITIGDGATVCDWWNGAVSFSVDRRDSTPYLVTPNFILEVKKGTKE
jgi:ABC-2 type transport system ATP-binding protein